MFRTGGGICAVKHLNPSTTRLPSKTFRNYSASSKLTGSRPNKSCLRRLHTVARRAAISAPILPRHSRIAAPKAKCCTNMKPASIYARQRRVTVNADVFYYRYRDYKPFVTNLVESITMSCEH